MKYDETYLNQNDDPVGMVPPDEQSYYVLAEYNYFGNRWSWFLFKRSLVNDINPSKIGEIRPAYLYAAGNKARDHRGTIYTVYNDSSAIQVDGRSKYWFTCERDVTEHENLKPILDEMEQSLQKAAALFSSIKANIHEVLLWRAVIVK